MTRGKSFWQRLLYYANPMTLFRKSDNDNINLKMMHGMNRISMIIFLVAVAVMIYKFLLS